jgi:hypothetical protein
MLSSARWLAALIASCAFLLAACDECSTDTFPTCAGNGIRSCQSTGALFTGASWHLQKCEAPNPYCGLGAPGQQPDCLATPAPVPECAVEPNDTDLCFQNSRAYCDNGYVKVSGVCDAGPCTLPSDPMACAFCDDGTTQADPGCAKNPQDRQACFESNVYNCECGRRSTLYEDCVSLGLVCMATGVAYGLTEYGCGDAMQDSDASFPDDAASEQ